MFPMGFCRWLWDVTEALVVCKGQWLYIFIPFQARALGLVPRACQFFLTLA